MQKKQWSLEDMQRDYNFEGCKTKMKENVKGWKHDLAVGVEEMQIPTETHRSKSCQRFYVSDIEHLTVVSVFYLSFCFLDLC